jgi:peptide-methionine (R)-S-oxide reductase
VAEPTITWQAVLQLAARGNPAPPQRIEKHEAEWQAELTQEQFYVLRQHGTERAHSSQMCSVFEPGLYGCGGCGTALFDATTKFESGTGWPSFTAPVVAGVVAYKSDGAYGMQRIEVLCNVCDGHLGHVFPDGPPPSGLRYCINAVSLRKLEKLS